MHTTLVYFFISIFDLIEGNLYNFAALMSIHMNAIGGAMISQANLAV